MILVILQWLSFALSAAGSFLVASYVARHRFYGFVLFMISNIVMIIWSFVTGNYGIFATQTVFVFSSSIGLRTSRKEVLEQRARVQAFEK